MMIKLPILLILCSLTPSLAYSNEAVEDLSLTITGSYLKSWIDTPAYVDYDSKRYSVEGTLTSQIPGTKYLGIGLDGTYHFQKTQYSYDGFSDGFFSYPKSESEFIGITKSLEAKLFLRDWQTGGILLGHEYLEESTVNKFRSADFYNRYSDTAYFNTSKVKAEYYFDQFTLAARYSYRNQSPYCCDDYNKGLILSFYPNDNHKIKVSGNQLSEKPVNDRSIYIYEIGFESQPQYFSGKVKFRADYTWNNLTSRSAGAIGIDYQFSDSSLFNSAPTIGIGYSESGGLRDAKIIGLNFGFQFDNRISLKDRDRKYLFDSGL